MSLREWLILGGVIVIVGVIIDGYRRMRLGRKRASELTFGIEEVKGYDESFSSELPNGGARRPDDADDFSEELSVESTAPKRIRREERTGRYERIEPDFDNMDFGSAVEEPELDLSEPVTAVAGKIKPHVETAPVQTGFGRDQMAEDVNPQSVAEFAEEPLPETAAQEPRVKAKGAAKKTDKGKEKLSDRTAIEEVVVINVLAKNNELFDGARLLQSVLASGMRFGDRSIFHRYSKKDGSGQIQFSMANGVKPGTFDIENMDATETTVLSLFLCLPGPEEPLKAFALMEEIAQQLALDLGGELKDENMSVMTQQTLEHCRQRIRDYERKQLTIKLSH